MMHDLKEKYSASFETLRLMHGRLSYCEETRFGDGCLDEMDSFIEDVILSQLDKTIENYLKTTALKEFIGNFFVSCSIRKSNGNVLMRSSSNPVFCFKTEAFTDVRLLKYCAEKCNLSVENIKFQKETVKVTFSIAF